MGDRTRRRLVAGAALGALLAAAASFSSAARASGPVKPHLVVAGAVPSAGVHRAVTGSGGAIVDSPGCHTGSFGPSDDGSSPSAVPLGFTINFYGQQDTSTWVNNNGNVSFQGPESQYTPDSLTTAGHFPTLAPFFADVDTRGAGSGVVTYGTTTYQGHAAFCVLWPYVGYFAGQTDKLDDFQLLIVDRPDLGTSPQGDDFDFYFNYNQIQWEAGQASGSPNGLCPPGSDSSSGCYSAHAGYTNGTGDPGTNYEVPGSGIGAAFLDSTPTGLIHRQGGSLGFQVHNGVVTPTLTVTGHNLGGTAQPLTVAGGIAGFTSSSTQPASAYTATVDWGDGSAAQPATVAGSPATGFTVQGTHTYAHDGVYAATTTVTSGVTGPGSAPSTVTVDAPLQALATSFIAPSTQASRITATFVDPDPGTPLSNYSATVDWGDGSPSQAAVVAAATGTTSHEFTVSAVHQFAAGGLFHVVTTITDINAGLTRHTQVTGTGAVTYCTDTWTGAVSADWFDGRNWSGQNGGFPPNAGDIACIAGGPGVQVAVTRSLETPVASLVLLNTSLTGGGGPVLDVASAAACGSRDMLDTTGDLAITRGSVLQLTGAGCVMAVGGGLSNQGTLSLQQGTLLSVAGTAANAAGGTLQLESARLSAVHSLQNAGTVAVAASLSGGTVAAVHRFAAATAPAGAHSDVSGSIVNAGTLSIPQGASLGVSGDYVQAPSGVLSLGLGSPFDALSVAGAASLGGVLQLVQPPSPEPPGSILVLASYGSESGAFAATTGAVGGTAAYGSRTLGAVLGRLTPLVTMTFPGGTIAAGDTAPFTFSVSAPPSLPGWLPPPAGRVSVSEGTRMLAAGDLALGRAAMRTRLSPGHHHLSLAYAGGGIWAAVSRSVTVAQASPPTPVTVHATYQGGQGSSSSAGVLSASTGTGQPPAPGTSATTPSTGGGGGSGGQSSGSGGGGSSRGGSHPGASKPGARGRSTGAVAFALPSIVSVLSPLQISTSLRLIAVNLLIALLLVLLLALPAELLNSAVKENYAEITGWMRITRGRASRVHQLASELPTHLALAAFVAVGAALYTLVDPSFGFNLATAAELVGLIGAFLVITVTHDLARSLYLRRHFRKGSRLTTFPAGLIFAVGLVLVSRVFHFQPGFIFGLMTGLAFSERLTDREDGHGLALAAIFVLFVSVAAWFVWIPVKQTVDASASPGFLFVVLDTLLATVWVAGIQSIIFAFIPLRFMDGEKVVAWSRLGWFGIYLLSMFIFVHTVLHPTSTRFGNSNEASILSLLILLLAFLAVAVTVWTFFFVRQRRRARLAAVTGETIEPG